MKDLMTILPRALEELNTIIQERRQMMECVYELGYYESVDDLEKQTVEALEKLASFVQAICNREVICCEYDAQIVRTLSWLSERLALRDQYHTDKRVVEQLLSLFKEAENDPFK